MRFNRKSRANILQRLNKVRSVLSRHWTNGLSINDIADINEAYIAVTDAVLMIEFLEEKYYKFQVFKKNYHYKS